MFLTATPLAALLILNRRQLKLPKYIFFLSLLTLLAAVFVGIGFIGVIFGDY